MNCVVISMPSGFYQALLEPWYSRAFQDVARDISSRFENSVFSDLEFPPNLMERNLKWLRLIKGEIRQSIEGLRGFHEWESTLTSMDLLCKRMDAWVCACNLDRVKWEHVSLNEFMNWLYYESAIYDNILDIFFKSAFASRGNALQRRTAKGLDDYYRLNIGDLSNHAYSLNCLSKAWASSEVQKYIYDALIWDISDAGFTTSIAVKSFNERNRNAA